VIPEKHIKDKFYTEFSEVRWFVGCQLTGGGSLHMAAKAQEITMYCTSIDPDKSG
jgi:hypothetical protein